MSYHLKKYAGSSKKYHFEEAGLNSRMDEIQAAILRVKLQHLDRWNQDRLNIAKIYTEKLGNINGVKLLIPTKESIPSWHLFPIRTRQRDQLQDFLDRRGIETVIHYPVPIHLQTGFRKYVKNYKKGDLPVAEEIAGTELSLPIYPGLSEKEIDYITGCILKFFSC